MGEVQAHAGGLLPVSTGISGKSFFKNIGQITGTDTCAVVPYTQYTAVISGRECKTQPGVCSAVFDCIADDLGKEKVQSSPIGTDGGLRKVGVDPEALFFQKRPIVFQYLFHTGADGEMLQEIVLSRTFQSGIEQHLINGFLHPVPDIIKSLHCSGSSSRRLSRNSVKRDRGIFVS